MSELKFIKSIFVDENSDFRPTWIPIMVMAIVLDWMAGHSHDL